MKIRILWMQFLGGGGGDNFVSSCLGDILEKARNSFIVQFFSFNQYRNVDDFKQVTVTIHLDKFSRVCNWRNLMAERTFMPIEGFPFNIRNIKRSL